MLPLPRPALVPVALACVTLTSVASAQLNALEEAKLVPAFGKAADQFGHGLALEGETLAVGAPQVGALLGRPGYVTIHGQGPGGWAATGLVLASNGISHDYFGFDLALDGDTLVVGAPQPNLGGPTGPGKVYFFRRAPAGWFEAAEVVPTAPPATNQSFGHSVDLEGQRAFVGAPGLGSGLPGQAYVLRRTPVGWIEEARVVAGDPPLGSDAFGWDVDGEGDTLVVGAPEANAVYVFEWNGVDWLETQKLVPPGPSGQFGRAVAVEGDQLLVGAPAEGATAEGRVHVFERGVDWQYRATLTHSNVVPFDGFGQTLSVADGVALIGAPGDYHYPPAKGKAYVFERTPAGWSEALELTGSDPLDKAGVGWRVATDGRRFALGATHDGAVVDGSVFVQRVFPPQQSYCPSLPNSTGQPALLSASGSESVSADGLVLEADKVPPGQAGLFVLGDQKTQIVLPGGTLCVGHAARLAPGLTTEGWRLIHALDLTLPPASQIHAGRTWHFQAWFRDPAGGGAGYGLSDALSITFRP